VPDSLRNRELFRAVIGKPDGAHLPFGFELQQRPPVILQRCAILGRPVHLVEIDALHTQSTQ
jgi:hypothetical protein